MKQPTQWPAIVEVALNLNQAAATYLALTASGDVSIEGISLYVSTAGAGLTSVSVVTNQTNPTTILTAAEGALAKLLVQKNLDYAFARFPFQLRSGQLLQYVIVGAGAGGEIKMVVTYRPAVQGTYARLA